MYEARAVAPRWSRSLNEGGRGLITGVQALVRLTLVQAERDRRIGLNTAGFVSGYRGSPLGTLDSTFAKVKDRLAEGRIVVQPAVNEEMAATAIGGTQHIAMSDGATVDGVFGLWYGKGPGVDRAADALRHANYAGASRLGGVIVAVGDDHQGKSSSLVVNSDGVCAALHLPILYPSDPGEVINLGIHGFAASRLSGSWLAMKILPEIADGAQTVSFDEADLVTVLPEIDQPQDGLHIRWPDTLLEQEFRQHRFRLRAVQRYVRANRLDRRLLGKDDARIGIVSAGKSWRDLREALRMLGVDEGTAEREGIACYKLGMIWPVEPEGLAEFAHGLDTLVVVEEKGPFVEAQLRSLLYGTEGAPRKIVRISIGGQEGLPDDGVLTPEDIAVQLAQLIGECGGSEDIAARARALAPKLAARTAAAFPVLRKAHFCSGCPHNTSTALPDGSRASGGIGCHSMAVWIADNTAIWAQMGGEGVQWTGLSHFTTERHTFANMGDGTYFHSGILAIRQAVAVGASMTYKILFNDAVAMTGGQKVDGELSVPRLVGQLRAEGVQSIRIVTDDPVKYELPAFRTDVPVAGRDDLDRVQREMRELPGVSVLIYDQMCATELRRHRKRGTLPDPQRRVFINEAVCEGCGDCSVQSNCLSIEPVETDIGVKRRINQSSCNKDMSCLRGFCPSFVSINGGQLRKSAPSSIDELLGEPIPQPAIPAEVSHTRILVAGIGGTGVVTIGALLSAAAEAAGFSVAVLDDVGMAQKGGAVQSSIHISRSPEEIQALRIPAGGADLVLACDQIVANGKEVMGAIDPGRTRVVSNGSVAITGDFIRAGNIVDAGLVHRRLEGRAGAGNVERYDFTMLAERLLGDAIASNLMMVGLALQRGLIPLSVETIEQAIDRSGTAVGMNRRAFQIGRLLAVSPDRILGRGEPRAAVPDSFDAILSHRMELLTGYQNARYADRYAAALDRIRSAEACLGASEDLAVSAGKSLAKLMAYKDEYEVARLFAESGFLRDVLARFEGRPRVSFHLAPPLIARRDPVSGRLRKRQFGPWLLPVFKVLARLKVLRGSWADPFGYSLERKTERALVVEFEQILDVLAQGLRPDNLEVAIKIARLPSEIKGFGHVKEAAIQAYRQRNAELMRDFSRVTERRADGEPVLVGAPR